MALLLLPFAFGGLLLAAAIAVWPYRVRFLRKADRLAFLVSTGASGLIGATVAGASGALLCLGLLAA